MQDRQMEGMARELEKMRKDLLQTTSAMTTDCMQRGTLESRSSSLIEGSVEGFVVYVA